MISEHKDKTAIIFIKCTFKNTLITATDLKGKTLFQKSSKSYDIKTKRKNNPYVLYKISYEIIKKLKQKKLGYKSLIICIQGIGNGRYNTIKHFTKFFKIIGIKDQTYLPFNGCRSKKQKRR